MHHTNNWFGFEYNKNKNILLHIRYVENLNTSLNSTLNNSKKKTELYIKIKMY